MDSMETLWVAYSKTSTENPFGRKMIGYAGWHLDGTSALTLAEARYPSYIGDIEVNRA